MKNLIALSIALVSFSQAAAQVGLPYPYDAGQRSWHAQPTYDIGRARWDGIRTAYHDAHAASHRWVDPALRTAFDRVNVGYNVPASYAPTLINPRQQVQYPPRHAWNGGCQRPADYRVPYSNRDQYQRYQNTRRILRDRDKYVQNNLYGDDTIYDRDQPVRNLFRFLFP